MPMPRPSWARYRRTPSDARPSLFNAASSCSPQSHRSEPNTSPVTHSEWRRTRTSCFPATFPFTRATCSSRGRGQTNAWIGKLRSGVGSRASLPSRMLSQSSPSKRAMPPGPDNSGVYKNAGRNQQRGMFPPVRNPSTCQMSRDECRSRPDRGRGLERQASSGQVEMVAAERIHIAVIEAARSQSEDEQDRGPMFQEFGQERRGRRFLRVWSIRGHDRFAELRRKTSLGEFERQESAAGRQLPEIGAGLADARRPRYPGRNVLGRAEVLLERETERRQVRVEGEGDGRRPRDRPPVCLGETRGIVRIVQPDR